VELEVDQTDKRVSLRVDGDPDAGLPPTSFPLPDGAMNPTFQFGAPLVHTPSTTWRVQLDNVRIDDL